MAAFPNFNDFLPIVLAEEGGFVDNPADPGGATNKGITQAVYDRFREGYGGQPKRSVALIEPIEIDWILRHWYYDECAAQTVSELGFTAPALQIFDHAVNAGPRAAQLLLQACVWSEAPEEIDGKIGPVTLGQLRHFNGQELADLYRVARLGFYIRAEDAKPEFWHDWRGRVCRVAGKGLALEQAVKS